MRLCFVGLVPVFVFAVLLILIRLAVASLGALGLVALHAVDITIVTACSFGVPQFLLLFSLIVVYELYASWSWQSSLLHSQLNFGFVLTVLIYFVIIGFFMQFTASLLLVLLMYPLMAL